MGKPRKVVRKKELEKFVRDIQVLSDEKIKEKYKREGVSEEQLQEVIKLARTLIKRRGKELEL